MWVCVLGGFAVVVVCDVWVCVLGGCGGLRFAVVVVAGVSNRFGSGFAVHFRFGIDGDCWLWVAMVVVGMGRLAVLGSHGGCQHGTAGSFG